MKKIGASERKLAGFFRASSHTTFTAHDTTDTCVPQAVRARLCVYLTMQARPANHTRTDARTHTHTHTLTLAVVEPIVQPRERRVPAAEAGGTLRVLCGYSAGTSRGTLRVLYGYSAHLAVVELLLEARERRAQRLGELEEELVQHEHRLLAHVPAKGHSIGSSTGPPGELQGYSRGPLRVLRVNSRGTPGVLQGYSRGKIRVL